MKNIITAINNPLINKSLKDNKKYKIIGKDIQYKEAILETLEKEILIDYIFIKENLPGQIKNLELIKKIKKINPKIKIIFILENPNKEKEIKLKKSNVKYILYKNEINYKNIINIIENKKIKNNKNNAKIILINGERKSGKTTMSILLSIYLSNKNKKTLIIDFNKNGLIKFLKNKKGLNKYFKKEKINLIEFKINNNLKIISKIKLNNEKNIYLLINKYINKYDFIILDINIQKINQKLIKKCYKIIYLFNLNFNNKKIDKINNKKTYLIKNKNNFKSLNSKIIFKSLKLKNKIINIKLRKEYKDIKIYKGKNKLSIYTKVKFYIIEKLILRTKFT